MEYKNTMMGITIDERLEAVFSAECKKLNTDRTKMVRKLVLRWLEGKGIKETDIFPELKEI